MLTLHAPLADQNKFQKKLNEKKKYIKSYRTREYKKIESIRRKYGRRSTTWFFDDVDAGSSITVALSVI